MFFFWKKRKNPKNAKTKVVLLLNKLRKQPKTIKNSEDEFKFQNGEVPSLWFFFVEKSKKPEKRQNKAVLLINDWFHEKNWTRLKNDYVLQKMAWNRH